MWIVFGWQKEEKPVGAAASGYCYDCRRQTLWFVWTESEWVTFSDERLTNRIETEQLARKTPQQLKFIRESMAAEREYRERLAQNPEDA